MLHLFKNVYLTIDELLDIHQDRMVLSRDFGHTMDVDIPNIGNLLLHTTAIDEIIGAGKRFPSYLEFFKFVETQSDNRQRQCIIYADKGTFIKLAVNFYKGLLPNAQASDIYLILKCYTNSIQLLSTSPDFYAPVQDQARLLSKCNLQQSEITAAYHSSTSTAFDFFDFFANKRQDLSIELIAATHGFNSKASAELDRLLKYFLAKHVFIAADEARHEITFQGLRSQARTVLNLAPTSVDTVVDVLKNAASTSIMFDNSIFRRSATTVEIENNFNNLNITELTVLAQTTYKAMRDLHGLRSVEGSLGVLEYMQAAMDLHNATAWPSWRERLLNELPGLIGDIEYGKVNVGFAWYVTDARNGDRGLLRPYVINGCQ